MRLGAPTDDHPNGNLWELAGIFLRLGLTAFGGPAAHIAMMHREFVEQREWLTNEEFLDLLGAVNLIPGPSSTELGMHIGRRRAGAMGLGLAGVCFIVPAMLIVGLLAWAYVRYGTTVQAGRLLYGVKAVIVAVVAQALLLLGKASLKTLPLGGCAVACMGLAAWGMAPLPVILSAGAAMGGWKWFSTRNRESLAPLARLLVLVAVFVGLAYVAGGHGTGRIAVSQGALFGFFLKVGAVLYGSGYVLLAYLNTDLVSRWGWMSHGQLLDAVAVGQFTPGPVFTTATFIGFLLGGPVGAIVATIGIFLPSFVFVALSGRVVPELRKSAVSGAFMDGVNAGSVAVTAFVAFELGRTALTDWVTCAIAVASLAILWRYKINSAWLVLAGAALGLGLPLIRS